MTGIRKPSDLPDPVPVVISVGFGATSRPGEPLPRLHLMRVRAKPGRRPPQAVIGVLRRLDERQPDPQVRPAEDPVLRVEEELASAPR